MIKQLGNAIIATLMFSTLARAEDPLIDASCNPIRQCAPTKECTVSRRYDNRDCHKCLLKNFLGGGCQLLGNDPVCEAQKAAQNAAMEADASAAQASCESLKASEKQYCELQIAQAREECLTRKNSAESGSGNDSNYEKLLLLPTPQVPLPMHVVESLSTPGTYEAQFLQSLTVTKLDSLDLVPAAFHDARAFTVGSRIFLKPGFELDALSQRDWITEVELAKLFGEYGFVSMSNALTHDAPAILSLVDSKADRLCLSFGC